MSNDTRDQTSHRPKRYTIDHEGMQRVSALGVINPSDGTRAYWRPDAATDFLVELQSKEGFDVGQYCHRCDSYDGELAIKPWQLKLPVKSRRSLHNADPVALPWLPGKFSEDVHLRDWEKSRPGRPVELNACHMCLISFLDEQEPLEITKEHAAALKAEFRDSREELARLHRARANESNTEKLAAYILRRLEQAKDRLRRASRALREAGFQPSKPRVVREGDSPPETIVTTEWRADS